MRSKFTLTIWPLSGRLDGLLYLGYIFCCIFCGGLAWFSPRCSAWVMCAKGHTLRSLEWPYGITSRDDVNEGNFCSRVLSTSSGGCFSLFCKPKSCAHVSTDSHVSVQDCVVGTFASRAPRQPGRSWCSCARCAEWWVIEQPLNSYLFHEWGGLRSTMPAGEKALLRSHISDVENMFIGNPLSFSSMCACACLRCR
jgi:hypothetical protein